MENRVNYEKKYTLLLYIAIIGVIAFSLLRMKNIGVIDTNMLQSFATIFTSIVLEGIPFILLGAFVSALIQVFVSEETITKIIPKNKFLGFFGASLMGFIFPVCECAIIPIARRLIKKGLPFGLGVTFMLAVPIVNPVVLLSTYYAFYDKPSMVIMRGGFGIIAAITIGIFISMVEKKAISPLKNNGYKDEYGCNCGCDINNPLYKYKSKLSIILDHTTREFLSISKYLIFGAFISGVFQTLVSRDVMTSLGSRPMASIGIMMALAFLLSICSEADAFIARTFLSQFTVGSILGFLLLGPMLDIKNTFMLFGNFKGKVAIILTVYIGLVVFIIAAYTNVAVMFGVIK